MVLLKPISRNELEVTARYDFTWMSSDSVRTQLYRDTMSCAIFEEKYQIFLFIICLIFTNLRGARWLRGQCAQRAIAEAKQRSQRSVIGWVTKIYYLELLLASEGTLSRWSRLHLLSLAPTLVSRRVDVRQAADCKNDWRIFITKMMKICCSNPI
jgi:hypothetical protein